MRRPLRGLLVAVPTFLACVSLRSAFSVSRAPHGQGHGAMRRRHVTSTSQRGSLQSTTLFLPGTLNIDDASIAPADVTLTEGSGVFISGTETTSSLEATASDSPSAVSTASASSSELWAFFKSTTPSTTASSTTAVSGLPSTTLSFNSASSIESSQAGSVTRSLSTTHSWLSTGSLSLTSSTSTASDAFTTASSSSSQSFSSQTSLSNTPSSFSFPSLSSTITFTLFPSEADTHTTSPSLSSTTPPVTSATSTISPADGSATLSSSPASTSADHSLTTLVDGEGVTPPPDSTAMPSEGDAQPLASAGVVLSQEGSPNMTPIPLLPVSAKKGEDFWHNPGAVAATFLVAGLIVAGVIFGLGLYLHSRKKQRYDRVSAHGEPHLEPPNFASGPPVSPFYRDPYAESDHGQSDTYQPLVLNEAVGQKLMHGWRPPRRSSTIFTDAPSVYSQESWHSPASHDGEFDPYRDFAAATSSGAGTTPNPLPAGAPTAKGPTFASPPSSSSYGLGPARQTAAGNGANLISTNAEMMAQGPPPRYASPYVPDRYLSTHIEESEPESNDDHEGGHDARTRGFDDGGFTDEPARVRLLQA